MGFRRVEKVQDKAPGKQSDGEPARKTVGWPGGHGSPDEAETTELTQLQSPDHTVVCLQHQQPVCSHGEIRLQN